MDKEVGHKCALAHTEALSLFCGGCAAYKHFARGLAEWKGEDIARFVFSFGAARDLAHLLGTQKGKR